MGASDYKIDNFFHLPHTIPAATETSAGVMTPAQVAKLNSLSPGGIAFTPTNPRVWVPQPTNMQQALDQLGGRNTPSAVFDPYDFGAVGDGVTDDGPAFNLAISALANAGGGILNVGNSNSGAPVSFFIRTPINNTTAGVSMHVRGAMTGTTLILSGGFDGSLPFRIHEFTQLTVEYLRFASDGVTRPANALDFANIQTLVIRQCFFDDMIAQNAIVFLSCNYARVLDCYMHGGNCSLAGAGNWTVTSGVTFQNLLCADGAVNGSYAWVLVIDNGGNPRYDSVGTHPNVFRNCGFDEVGGFRAIVVRPTNGNRVSRVILEGVDNLVSAAEFEIHDTDDVLISACGAEQRAIPDGGTIQLFNVARTRIDRFVTAKNFVDPAAPGAEVIVVADNLCGTLEVIDSNVDSIISRAASTMVSNAGLLQYVTPATNVNNNTLVKVDSANPGQYTTALHTDAPSVVVGVCTKGTAVATSGPISMPAANTIPNLSTWGIQGDDHTSAANFQFRNDGQPASPSFFLVDIQGLTTAAQAAAAFSAVINAQTGVNFSITSSVDGAGHITIFATAPGAQFDRRFEILSPIFQGLSSGVLGGSATTTVIRGQGQIAPVTSDGTGVIAAGDPITLSTTVDGQVMKATVGNIVGRAIAGAAAITGTVFNIVFSKEAI